MNEKPKIAYLGSDAVCLPGLIHLHQSSPGLCQIAAVISQPDRRQGRGKKLQPNPVAAYASEHGLMLLQPDKPGPEIAGFLREQGVALGFVMAYGHFLPKAVREAPLHGMLNFHGSILPAYRGASPVETAIAMGEKETGVCLMQVAKEMDAGAVADCEKVCIGETDIAPGVREKIGLAVVPLLQRNIEAALVGCLDFEAQDHSRASFCRKITKEDAALDFYLSAREIDARLRAFTPWPGAYFDHGSIRIKVGRVRYADEGRQEPPGTVLPADGTLDVATGNGVLLIQELQRPGGRMLPVKEFLKGYSITPDTVLPSVHEAEPLLRKNQG